MVSESREVEKFRTYLDARDGYLRAAISISLRTFVQERNLLVTPKEINDFVRMAMLNATQEWSDDVPFPADEERPEPVIGGAS